MSQLFLLKACNCTTILIFLTYSKVLSDVQLIVKEYFSIIYTFKLLERTYPVYTMCFQISIIHCWSFKRK